MSEVRIVVRAAPAGNVLSASDPKWRHAVHGRVIENAWKVCSVKTVFVRSLYCAGAVVDALWRSRWRPSLHL